MVSCLGEAGGNILGMPAADLHAMKDDFEGLKAMNLGLQWTPMKITVRAKIDDSGY